MTPQELVDRLGALDAAATPGPWFVPVGSQMGVTSDTREFVGVGTTAPNADLIAEGRTLGVVAGRIVADMLNRHTPFTPHYGCDPLECPEADRSCAGCGNEHPCPDRLAADRIIREAGL